MSLAKQSLTTVLVDDNRQMLSVVRSMLNSYGIERIHDFPSAEEALPTLRNEHVDLVLVDIEPAGKLDGLQFSKFVRHDPMIYNPCVPIILMTGFASQALINKAINFGIDGMVTRPLSARDLHARIHKVLNFPRSYIRTPSGYFGPDRRRRADPLYDGPERRIIEMAQVVNGAEMLRQPEPRVTTQPFVPQDLSVKEQTSVKPAEKASDIFFLD